MSTKEVAEKLVNYIRKGQIALAQEELYADDIVCVEPPATFNQELTKGKKDVIEKRKQFEAMIKEKHFCSCSDPLVSGCYITLKMTFDFTLKGLGHQRVDEVGVYEVQDGKIIHEQFFYSQPAFVV